MDKIKVLETIAKISALSNDSAAFQGEISSASAKIEMLMRKYIISQSEVDNFMADKQEKEQKEEMGSVYSSERHAAIKNWHWDLAILISGITYTRNYSQGKRMVFFGMESNAKIASELYVLWFQDIERMADQANKLHRREIVKKYGDRKNFFKWVSENYPEDNPTYFRVSWIAGCIRGMLETIREEEMARETGKTNSATVTGSEDENNQEETQAQANSIVLYEEQVDLAYRQMAKSFRRVSASSPKGFSSTGFSKGQETGKSIRISSKRME